MNQSKIIEQLIKISGEKNVLFDDDSKYIYGRDLTQNHLPDPLAIIFPKTEDEVISIVKLANSTRTGLVPSGGRTGYSGGAVSLSKEIVVSFEKFNRILDFNPTDRQIRCEPGVTTKAIQDFAATNHLYYPVDFSSAGTSQIGGNISTNAGGIKVIRYGMTRNWVAGIKVITGNGELLNLNAGLLKNSTGYDLRQLFIGSEGTLGFITEATLQLILPPKETKTLLLAISDKNNLIEILNAFNPFLQITAFEFFSELALQYVLKQTQLDHPFLSSSPFYLLVEFESDEQTDKFYTDIIEKCIHRKIIDNALVSSNLAQAKKLWRFREEISMSILKYSPYKYDIAVLPSKIPTFMSEVDNLFERNYPNMEIIWFGHVGDGNLHLNILKPAELSVDNFFSYCNKISDELYMFVQKNNGSVSAEHGIGLLKKNFLHYSRDEHEINYMKSIKKIFDANNIMNPGKIFEIVI